MPVFSCDHSERNIILHKLATSHSKFQKLEFVLSSHGKSTCIDLRVGDSSTRIFLHIRHEVAYPNLASIARPFNQSWKKENEVNFDKTPKAVLMGQRTTIGSYEQLLLFACLDTSPPKHVRALSKIITRWLRNERSDISHHYGRFRVKLFIWGCDMLLEQTSRLSLTLD